MSKGSMARVGRYVPLILTSQVFHQSSGSLSAILRLVPPNPALLIKISKAPNSDFTFSAADFTDAVSEISTARERILGVGRLEVWAAAMISVSREEREDRATSTRRLAPARANDNAVALPIPFEAPVMRTVRLERSSLVGSM